jgi:proteasome lid subunit RPN8/RPN11
MRRDENQHRLPILPPDVYAHCFESEGIEVGGVLVGRPSEGAAPNVLASLRVPDQRRPAPLVFTSESWEHIHTELQRRYPGEQIVGWYHSYPGFGLFVSQQDGFIHNGLFKNAGHVFVVIDPKLGQEAVFAWRRDELVERFRRDCNYQPVEITTKASRRRNLDHGISPMLFGLIELNPRTTRPTLVANLYLLIIIFAVGVLIWATLFR